MIYKQNIFNIMYKLFLNKNLFNIIIMHIYFNIYILIKTI